MPLRAIRRLLPWLGAVTALAAGAAAQTPTPAAAPKPVAILILTKAPRQLDGAALRQMLQRVYGARLPATAPADGHGDWIEPGDGTAAMRIDGVLFRITIGDRPWDLGGVTLPADDPLSAPLRAHRGYLLLQAAEEPEAAPRRVAIYRVMGRLASALLADDCVAIGLVEHGVFRAADAEAAADLVGADVVRAFAPVGSAAVMVLLQAPRQLDSNALRAACKRAFGVEFAAPGTAGAANVAAMRGDDGLVRFGKVPILLHCSDDKVLDTKALEGRGDAAVQAAVAAHHAGLQLVSVDRYADAAQLRQRYAELCHLLGELWGDDCLLLSLASDRRLVLATDATGSILRGDDPVAGLAQSERK